MATVQFEAAADAALAKKLPIVDEIAKDASGLLVKVDSADSCALAGQFIRRLKQLKKDLEDDRSSIVKPFNDGVKAINERFRSKTVPIDDLIARLDRSVIAWTNAERERVRLENERLEKERVEKERAAAEARAKASAAETSGSRLDRLIASEQASTAQAAADDALIAQVSAPTAPKLSTISGGAVHTRKVWTATVSNPIEVLRAMLADEARTTIALQAGAAEFAQKCALAMVRAGFRELPGASIFQKESVV